MTRRDALRASLFGVAVLAGCAPAIPGIVWDQDVCDFCRMTISDRRFGAAAVATGGRTMHFDSIECLAAWVDAQPAFPRALWLSDATAPGALHPLAELRFHRTAVGHSPMGKGFVAVARSTTDSTWDGPEVTWDEVRAAVASEGMAGQVGP